MLIGRPLKVIKFDDISSANANLPPKLKPFNAGDVDTCRIEGSVNVRTVDLNKQPDSTDGETVAWKETNFVAHIRADKFEARSRIIGGLFVCTMLVYHLYIACRILTILQSNDCSVYYSNAIRFNESPSVAGEYYLETMENNSAIPLMSVNSLCYTNRDVINQVLGHPLDYQKNVLPFRSDCVKFFYLGKDEFVFVCKDNMTNEALVIFNHAFFNSDKKIFHGTKHRFELRWDQFCSLLNVSDKIAEIIDKLYF